MTDGERMTAFDAEKVERIEAGVTEKTYEEIMAELATNKNALAHTNESIVITRTELDRLHAQKSVLLARKEALENAARIARDKGLE